MWFNGKYCISETKNQNWSDKPSTTPSKLVLNSLEDPQKNQTEMDSSERFAKGSTC